jgi:hypothetical protein
MAYKIGFEGILYRNTGSYGSPTWDAIPNVKDVELTMEREEADTSNRAGGGWETILPGLKKATIEGEMNYDPADTDWVAMQAACYAGTLIEYGMADAAIASAGTQYFRAHCYITKFGRRESLREAMTTPFTLRPGFTSSANPAWVTVSA